MQRVAILSLIFLHQLRFQASTNVYYKQITLRHLRQLLSLSKRIVLYFLGVTRLSPASLFILSTHPKRDSHSPSSRLMKSCRSSRSPVRRFWDRSIMCARGPMWWPMARRSRPLSLSLTDCRVSRICRSKREH